MAAIENKEQYDWAVNQVEQLLPLVKDNTPKNDPNSIELELLSNMVAEYSDKHYAIGEPSRSDVIKLRMEEMGLTLSNVAKLMGITPTRMKDYLTGNKEPTLRIGKQISRQLGVDANIVLGV